jgi:hypothetical protein
MIEAGADGLLAGVAPDRAFASGNIRFRSGQSARGRRNASRSASDRSRVANVQRAARKLAEKRRLTLRISDFQNREPRFSTRPGPFAIAAAEHGSLAIVDLLVVKSSKTPRFRDRAGQRKRKDRFDLRLPPA